jgi:hypothetical protein
VSRFLVLRVNKDPRDTYAVPYHGDDGEGVFSALDAALPDPGSRVDYAVVDARDAVAARFAPHGTDWETVPSRWVKGWQQDMPELLQGASGEKLTDKRSIEQLAKMFDLPDWDRIDEMNQQFYWETAHGAGDEDAQMEAEREARDEVYAQWYDGVQQAAAELFGHHELELEPIKGRGADRRPYMFRIVPAVAGKYGWQRAANAIRETVNGVGSFHYNNLREFLDSGPYTARQAALSHLHWIPRYSDVYGTASAQRLYKQAWR